MFINSFGVKLKLDISIELSTIKDGSVILLAPLFFSKNNDRYILGRYLKAIKYRSIFQKNYLLLTSNNKGFLQTNNSIFFGRKKT